MPLMIEIILVILVIGILILQLKSKKRKFNSIKDNIHEQLNTIDQINEIKDLELKLEEKKKKLFEQQ